MTPRGRCRLLAVVPLVLALFGPGTAEAADYTGPMIDAHSHLPSAKAIEAYVAAMKRHNIGKVVLLGVGGVQKDDEAWITAAARRYPDQVIVGLPVADPTSEAAVDGLEAKITKTGGRALGEIHIRQLSRKIDRNPADVPFVKLLQAAARQRVPVVIHDELDDRASQRLEDALRAEPKATIVLAHAGESAPTRLERLLGRHPNLMVDLSGMHFQRKPALASESGPLEPDWKALIEKMPDRFLMGIDVWAPRLFEPAMLDRLMRWTRRVLGELKPEVAERVAYGNAAALFGVK
jgi:predicted TIM-barrel fold metal-dependent hydrolase